MLPLELKRVRENVRAATTEDLLDRVTVYADGMEPAALELIEGELISRGLSREQIRKHEDGRRAEMLIGRDGLPPSCSLCERPAVVRAWGWHRLWGVLPLFPRLFYFCTVHKPVSEESGIGNQESESPDS
jgi:hypothetical protein